MGVTGLRTAAFFFGHQVMHVIDILVQPAIFMSVYYTLTLPEIKFVNYYISARSSTSLSFKSQNLVCFSLNFRDVPIRSGALQCIFTASTVKQPCLSTSALAVPVHVPLIQLLLLRQAPPVGNSTQC